MKNTARKSAHRAIVLAMQEEGISREELAVRLGVTPARVSQMLGAEGSGRGIQNLTLDILEQIGRALGREVRVELR